MRSVGPDGTTVFVYDARGRLAAEYSDSSAASRGVQYLTADTLGSVRIVTDGSGGVVSRHDFLPFGEEIGTSYGRTAAALKYGLADGLKQRFTGKERDGESGLDYFGARYFSSQQGRFMSPDEPFADQHVTDPQSWNLYAYARNNPVRYRDPDGRAIETPWDAFNVALDAASLTANVAAGNWGGAAVDAGGLILDAAATVIPGVPGGAGTAIKLARAADKVADAVLAADNVADAAKVAGNVADVAKVAKGGESAAAKGGRAAHREFADKVKAKAADGWQSEPRIKGPDGKVLKPDAITPGGRPVELKPNTPSGRRAGATQLKKYEEATGKKGRVVRYDP